MLVILSIYNKYVILFRNQKKHTLTCISSYFFLLSVFPDPSMQNYALFEHLYIESPRTDELYQGIILIGSILSKSMDFQRHFDTEYPCSIFTVLRNP